jgi:hypothetical protein
MTVNWILTMFGLYQIFKKRKVDVVTSIEFQLEISKVLIIQTSVYNLR